MEELKIPDEIKNEGRPVQVPGVIPIMPLFNVAVYPRMMFPMEVSGEQAIQLVDEAMPKDRVMGLLLAKTQPQEAKLDRSHFHDIGTSAVILKMAKIGDNKAQLLVQGISRFRVREFVEGKPYIQARVETLEDVGGMDIEVEALMANLVTLFDRIVKLSPFLPQEFGAMAKNISEPGILADIIASVINVTMEEKQKILEALEVKDRLREVTRLVNHQVEILELGSKIQSQVKNDIDKSQREYYLRQQLAAIKKELGESEESKVEIEEYRAKIEEKNLPEEAKKEALRELERLSRMHPSSAEFTVASTYLDWVTALPWNESTEDNLDIRKARKVLDEDHYGLEKPKKRGSSSASPWAGCGTRRRSGGTAGPTWGPCRAASSRGSGGPSRTTPSSCSTRSTSWAAISGGTRPRPSWRSWTRRRTTPSRTTTWTCPSTSRR